MDKFDDLDRAIGRGTSHDLSEPEDWELLQWIEGEDFENHLDQYFSDEARCCSVLNKEVPLNPTERRALRDDFVEARGRYGSTTFAIFEEANADSGERFVLVEFEEAMMGKSRGSVRGRWSTLKELLGDLEGGDVRVDWEYKPS